MEWWCDEMRWVVLGDNQLWWSPSQLQSIPKPPRPLVVIPDLCTESQMLQSSKNIIWELLLDHMAQELNHGLRVGDELTIVSSAAIHIYIESTSLARESLEFSLWISPASYLLWGLWLDLGLPLQVGGCWLFYEMEMTVWGFWERPVVWFFFLVGWFGGLGFREWVRYRGGEVVGWLGDAQCMCVKSS